MRDNRVHGRSVCCGKIWLCEPGKFMGDEEAFIKLHHRRSMHCDCIHSGEIKIIEDKK